MKKFETREQAGKLLANKLANYLNRKDVLALALPRGGVPVAFEIAQSLNIPLNVFIVRKLGTPACQELAMGAIASDGTLLLNNEMIKELGVTQAEIELEIEQEKKELQRRQALYQLDNYLELENKTILLIDDGIATGYTMQVAITALRHHQPAQIIAITPVVAASTYKELKPYADNIVSLLKPVVFRAVGEWYQHFTQTSDKEVCELLKKSRKLYKNSRPSAK